jgi:uncharacterized membrane protein YgaE (UPF0421/DUF939 family)
MNLGGRVIKTVVAVALSVFIAQQLGLERVTFAGIIAIISVQRSLYSSINQAYKKIGSVVLGSLIGGLFAYSFGQNPLAVAAATFVVIQVSLKFHLEDNIVLMTITALNLMLFSTGDFFPYAGNQLALALIGAISGLSLNLLYSPYHKKEVEELLFQADKEMRELMAIILQDMKGAEKYDIEDFTGRLAQLRENIEEGRRMAKLLQEEQRYRFVEDTPSERYRKAFNIFAYQADRIDDLDNLARKIECCIPQVFPIIQVGRIIAKMQERALKGSPYPYKLFERCMAKKEKEFVEGPLPVNQVEFINQAALLHILSELKKYYRNVRKLPSF